MYAATLGFTSLVLLFYFELFLMSFPGFDLGKAGLVPSKSEIHQTARGSRYHHDTQTVLGLAIYRIRGPSGDARNEKSVLSNKTVFLISSLRMAEQRTEGIQLLLARGHMLIIGACYRIA
jgi:hypothetical protein